MNQIKEKLLADGHVGFAMNALEEVCGGLPVRKSKIATGEVMQDFEAKPGESAEAAE